MESAFGKENVPVDPQTYEKNLYPSSEISRYCITVLILCEYRNFKFTTKQPYILFYSKILFHELFNNTK